mmetsp:Transcript_48461/g.52371  ORF Transcript_48461/g.52371 Transcript_48461/m.52371 type:complete len:429 (+) Transcript_48461:57-1343(+)
MPSSISSLRPLGVCLLQVLIVAALISISCSLSTTSRRNFFHSASVTVTAGLTSQVIVWEAVSAPTAAPMICVTGANGYIGLHCVSQLLGAGYFVRAAVRSLSDDKTKWLTKVATDAGAINRLSFAIINLTDVDSMADAVRGCDSLVHLASPYSIKASREDPNKSIVEPAVSGACNAVLAAQKVGLRRVVSCGSVFGVVGSGSERGYDHVYNNRDINGFNTLKGCSYSYSKKESQEKSIALANELGVDMVTLNVGQVCGPALSPDQINPSWEPFKILGSPPQGGGGVLSACVPAMVDVRDVALAHVAALKLPAPASSLETTRRYIVAAQKSSPTYVEIAGLMAEILPERKLPSNVDVLPPTVQKLIVKGIGFGDKSLGELISSVSVPPGGATILMDIEPMIKDLVPEPRTIKTTLTDWVNNQLEYGHSV